MTHFWLHYYFSNGLVQPPSTKILLWQKYARWLVVGSFFDIYVFMFLVWWFGTACHILLHVFNNFNSISIRSMYSIKNEPNVGGYTMPYIWDIYCMLCPVFQLGKTQVVEFDWDFSEKQCEKPRSSIESFPYLANYSEDLPPGTHKTCASHNDRKIQVSIDSTALLCRYGSPSNCEP